MTRLSAILAFTFLTLLLSAVPAVLSSPGDDWLPISPEELALKDNPASPGSHAMILYREQITDESNFGHFNTTHYYRLKIFSEEGKKYADVQIPFFKGGSHVTDIKARTVHPDGRVVEFEGEVFEKTIVKSRDLKFLAKTFTLTDVQPGSLIEYKYKIAWDKPLFAILLSSRWPLQDELFMRRAVFSLRPLPYVSIHWTGRSPNGEQIQNDHGLIRIEVKNIPGIVEEDYMPPEDELKPHVDFYYSNQHLETPDQFWKRVGKERNESIEKFIGKHKEAEELVAQAISPNDSPEIKLRKLYQRVQQIRNLTFEREKTEKEEKREKLKDNNHVGDVIKHGYGRGNEINYVYVAVARAAGFDASIVEVAKRDRIFFDHSLLNENQLSDKVVEVRVGTQDFYLDPATRLCPFGLLPWAETDAAGIRLDKQGGVFLTTPAPKSADALTERKATLELEPDGTLAGKLQVAFSGLQALRRRLEAMEEDEPGHLKDLEDEIKQWLPAGADLKLGSVTGWEGSEEPLRVEATLRIPNFGVTAGRRILLPIGIFEAGEAHPFQHANRTHPVYFHYPYEEVDDVTVNLAAGYGVETLPAPQKVPRGPLDYQLAATQQHGALHIERHLAVGAIFVKLEYYPALRAFFSNVRTGDEQQVVLQAAKSPE